MGSYACAHVTPITVWVVTKNESNCLLENKIISIVIWRRQVTVVCLVKHFTCHRFRILLSLKPFSSQKNNSCTPCVPMFSIVCIVSSRPRYQAEFNRSKVAYYETLSSGVYYIYACFKMFYWYPSAQRSTSGPTKVSKTRKYCFQLKRRKCINKTDNRNVLIKNKSFNSVI